MQKKPGSENHPDRHHAREHAGYARRDTFLPFAEKAAADEHHEKGKDEALSAVRECGADPFSIQPCGQVENSPGQSHAHTAKQKRREAFQCEFDADIARTP